jgi:hypothetical protein
MHIHFQHFSIYLYLLFSNYSRLLSNNTFITFIFNTLESPTFLDPGPFSPQKKPFITFIFNTFLFIFIYFYSNIEDSSPKPRSSHSFSALWSLPCFYADPGPSCPQKSRSSHSFSTIFYFFFYCFFNPRLLPSEKPFITFIFNTFLFSFYLLLFILIQDSSPQKSRSSHSFSTLFYFLFTYIYVTIVLG